MNKGFTLIELLATIVIMAIILLMVLPAITALQENNKDRPYEYYGDSIEEAAKTYVTKEGEDITDLGVEKWEGCVDITYDDLISAGLIKPFDDENYNCSINTKVRYTKDAEGKESYEYNMTCEDKNGNVVYEHKGIENDEECSVIDQSDFTPPECKEAIGESTEWTKEKRTITMTCSDDESGCAGNVTKLYNSEGNFTNQSPGTVSDNVGNKTTCPNNQTVKIDRTAPRYTSVFPACGDPTHTGKTAYVELHFEDTLSGLGYRNTSDWDCSYTVNFPDVNYNGVASAGDILATRCSWLGFHHYICDVAGNCNQWDDARVNFNC